MANQLIGEIGNDTITGTEGADVIQGLEGDDRLIAGGGNDTLIGGRGADTFVVAWNGGLDLLVDLEPGIDRIEVTGAPGQPPARLWQTERAGGGTYLEFDFQDGVIVPGGLSLEGAQASITGTGAEFGIPGHPPWVWALEPVDMDGTEGEAFVFDIVRLGGGMGAPAAAATATWSFVAEGWPDPADAADAGPAASGQVEFAEGETSKRVVFHVGQDTLAEADEHFAIEGSFSGGGFAGPLLPTVGGIIRNDDPGQPGGPGPWWQSSAFQVLFDPGDYLAANPDVRAAGVDPLAHYTSSGWTEGRDPSRAFGGTQYLDANPDVRAAGMNPLEHYISFGLAEGRSAFAAPGLGMAGAFDRLFYRDANPDVAAAGADPLQHFESAGWQEGRDPNALFDMNGYLAAYLDVQAAGVNPFTHYMTQGWLEGRDPSTGFDTSAYLDANPDVRAAGINPLEHFLQHGQAEGRASLGDSLWT
jgi:hypothetical protein